MSAVRFAPRVPTLGEESATAFHAAGQRPRGRGGWAGYTVEGGGSRGGSGGRNGGGRRRRRSGAPQLNSFRAVGESATDGADDGADGADDVDDADGGSPPPGHAAEGPWEGPWAGGWRASGPASLFAALAGAAVAVFVLSRYRRKRQHGDGYHSLSSLPRMPSWVSVPDLEGCYRPGYTPQTPGTDRPGTESKRKGRRARLPLPSSWEPPLVPPLTFIGNGSSIDDGFDHPGAEPTIGRRGKESPDCGRALTLADGIASRRGFVRAHASAAAPPSPPARRSPRHSCAPSPHSRGRGCQPVAMAAPRQRQSSHPLTRRRRAYGAVRTRWHVCPQAYNPSFQHLPDDTDGVAVEGAPAIADATAHTQHATEWASLDHHHHHHCATERQRRGSRLSTSPTSREGRRSRDTRESRASRAGDAVSRRDGYESASSRDSATCSGRRGTRGDVASMMAGVMATLMGDESSGRRAPRKEKESRDAACRAV